MKGARILIVEDEAIVALDLARRLEAMGYAIAASVSTGEEAVEAVRREAPDLGLVDVRLRGRLSGAHAVLQMRELASFPIVFLTAYSDDETLEEIKRCEPRGYLLKPFDERALWVTIETALHTHDAERKRAAAEAALRRSDALCAAILEHSHDGIICGDQNSRITVFNQGARATFGYAPGDVLGRPLSTVLPLDVTSRLETLAEILSQGGTPTRHPGETLNTTARRKSGEEFPVCVSISCVEVDGGAVSAAFVSDLSEHHALQRKIARAAQLDAVARRAGGAAHDFNNLLTGVLGYARLLKTSFAPGDPRLHDIEEIEQAGARAARLVGELLAYGRPQDRPEQSDLATVLARMERLLSHLVAPHCSVEVCVEGKLPNIGVGALKMEQVVLNLVLNARDAMPTGGTVRVHARRADDAERGPLVLLSVADDGIGMDEATRSQLFEPFFTTRAEHGGTGLGLASVHEIVTNCGGRIRVESAPGAGSRFEVSLPAADVVPPEASRASAGLPANTVLLVDDEPMVREVAARVLRESGYQVLVAADGREGLEVVEAHDGALDLMVTDVVMPEMNGYQLAARAAAIRPELRIALMSGFGAGPLGDPRLHAVRAELPLIEKPFNADVLLRRVAELLAEPPR